jgi:hypothetical protein
LFSGSSHSFVASFYWCLTTFTTTGYGDITPQSTAQTAFNVLISLTGPCVFAIIIGKFASYVKK